jgi:hypothetical protein
MDKLLNGVEALTSKSGLLNGLIGLAERFVPQSEVHAASGCGRQCVISKRKCGHARGHWRVGFCDKGVVEFYSHECSTRCRPKN